MHVLTVLDHPNPNAFSRAIAERFMDGAREAGHTTELANLHTDGFDPRWSQADIDAGDETPLPADVLREQERVERSDAICLVFPLYWWGMPAMTKGWIDRVWSWGWAYDQLADPDTSRLKPRPGLMLVPAGANSDDIDAKGHRAALERAWIDGTFGFFGFSPRRLELLCGSTGSDERRAGLLARSYEFGTQIGAGG